MNPNENNPVSPMGGNGAVAGAAPSVPSPVDFTNPASLNNNTSSLSMADSLASAQDNLTSAGQAANTGASNTLGLDELGATNPSATMQRPQEALTPADPVPGSIGSVTSVPPLATAPVDMGGLSGNTTPAPNPAPAMTAPAATPNAAPAPGVANTPASAKPVQPYFNPFARTGGTTPASSTTVPPTMQPQTEKFSAKPNGANGGKKSGNLVGMIGWILAIVFAATTVVFLVLWMGAKDQKEIVYIDRPAPETPTEEDVVTEISCTQDVTEPVIEGLENLTGERREVSLRFTNDVLTQLNLANSYTFVDDFAAENARAYFEGQTNRYGEIASGLGIAAITTNLNIEDSTAHYDVSATPEQLTGDYLGVFSLTVDEAGNLDTSIDGLQATYTGLGYICAVAE